MRPESSEVGTKGSRVRPHTGSRRGPARHSMLRRLALEGLEARTLLATSPVSLSTLTPATLLASSNKAISAQRGNESAPTIAVDQNNPLKLAATWSVLDPQNPA